MPRVAGIIVNLVPYHHARWDAFARSTGWETHLVELTDRDEFKVLEFSADARFNRHTLSSSEHGGRHGLFTDMDAMLNTLSPDVVCVSGWGLAVSLAAMRWAARNRVPLVMFSESNEFDEARSPVKEMFKSRLVGLCSAALAGGTPQAAYLEKLGMAKNRIFVGYDAVDNGYFAESTCGLAGNDADREALGLPANYFLACSRFGKKKNIPGLIRAYAAYHRNSPDGHKPFDLVIAGDGEERAVIVSTISECGVGEHVHLVGPKGYKELPHYYAHAAAFIHASTTEQWGLVVNEAMASGLPVLASRRCGCVTDLLSDGVNGWTFDPDNEEELSRLMLRIASDPDLRSEMGKRSREIISQWGPARFSEGLRSAVNTALANPKTKAGLFEKLILELSCRKVS